MKNYLSRSGYNKLVSELDELKRVQLREALNDISDSKSFGSDLSENSEYLSAKEVFDEVKRKITKLEEKLKNSEIVDKTQSDKVQILSSVRVKNLTHNREMIFTIVSEDEIDIKSGKISYNSPIGSALDGKSVGDRVNVNVPSGVVSFEILSIS